MKQDWRNCRNYSRFTQEWLPSAVMLTFASVAAYSVYIAAQNINTNLRAKDNKLGEMVGEMDDFHGKYFPTNRLAAINSDR